MSKEKPADPEKEARRAAKAAKKEAKRSETNGVHKSKSEKKDKKLKKEENVDVEMADAEVTTKLLNTLEETKPGSVAVREETGDLKIKIKSAPSREDLVKFANPLAEDKSVKKVLKCVKKAAKNKSLQRGVKEVNKSLRKSPLATATASSKDIPAIVVIAADISPMDVISHLPVLCEDHAVPYIFVPSRAELGAASSTKRPTSVVMVSKEARGGKKGQEEGGEDFGEAYGELVKLVVKAGRDVRV